MALTTYTYSLANDFPNQSVDAGTLDAEIRASSIVTVLDGVSVNPPDDVLITFVDPITTEEETTLDGVVAAHQGVPFIDTPQRVNQLAEEDNDTTTWSQALPLTLGGALAGGSWQLTWYCEIRVVTNNGTSGVLARVTQDGVERAFSSSDSDFYQSFSGSALFNFDNGDTPLFELQFRRIGSANTAQIRRCQIALVPEDT